MQHRPDVVVRRTDNSKVFYVGNAATFARKAMESMIYTEANQAIPNNDFPVTENLGRVTTLLNALLEGGAINQYHHETMCLSKVILELSHFHFHTEATRGKFVFFPESKYSIDTSVLSFHS